MKTVVRKKLSRPSNRNIWKPRITDELPVHNSIYRRAYQICLLQVFCALRRNCFSGCVFAGGWFCNFANGFCQGGFVCWNFPGDCCNRSGNYCSLVFSKDRNYRLSQFRKTGNSVSYELSEEFFKAKSEMGSTELKWNSFKAIWIFQKFPVVSFCTMNGYLTLPADQISNDVKEFLKRKIISVGGKVK